MKRAAPFIPLARPSVGVFFALGIDQGTHRSGWCVSRCGEGPARHVESGTARGDLLGFADRARVVARFLELAGDHPVVVCFEDHGKVPLRAGTRHDKAHGGRKSPDRGTATIIGMGAVRGRWEESLLRVLTPAQVKHSVTPEDWGRDVCGMPRVVTRVVRQQRSVQWATAWSGKPLVYAEDGADCDEAAACAISAWVGLHVAPVKIRARKGAGASEFNAGVGDSILGKGRTP